MTISCLWSVIMTTMPREAWTDERLDDLKDGMHREFAQVRREMDRRFDEVDARFDRQDGRFDALNARFDALQGTLIAGALAIAAAIIAAGIF
jgi:hypothetical protein